MNANPNSFLDNSENYTFKETSSIDLKVFVFKPDNWKASEKIRLLFFILVVVGIIVTLPNLWPMLSTTLLRDMFALFQITELDPQKIHKRLIQFEMLKMPLPLSEKMRINLESTEIE